MPLAVGYGNKYPLYIYIKTYIYIGNMTHVFEIFKLYDIYVEFKQKENT